ncbi:hypothetical protein A6V36_29825 [Paraburkholderia ginsengiterrae]|uniref:Uncharacterized protein n=1 Tax=Paraburkholderia ginsengiterrae TaxID=1462993 RepID=A0A1A9NB54_9BURK|nr:hypothetical protein A6V36_29825 [Paraburkholderia ginsengiterrae]OAJ63599.1 hypothetical protein A6V37_19890 [Paraburkholderia ginsengiterrae]
MVTLGAGAIYADCIQLRLRYAFKNVGVLPEQIHTEQNFQEKIGFMRIFKFRIFIEMQYKRNITFTLALLCWTTEIQKISESDWPTRSPRIPRQC